MKLYTFQTFTIIFVTVFFVITNGEESVGAESGTAGGRRLSTFAHATSSVYPNDVALGKTPTRMNFKITVSSGGALTANNAITVTSDTDIFVAKDGLSLTPVSGIGIGSATVGCALSGETTSTKILVVTLGTGCTIANSAVAIFYLDSSISLNQGVFAANKDSLATGGTGTTTGNGVVKFQIKTAAEVTDSTSTQYYALGRIAPYYLQSSCGAAVAVVAQACVENPCEACNAAGGFLVTSGTQTDDDVDPNSPKCASTDSGGPANIRCDAMYYTDTAVDIYFTTNGNYGTAVCGAYEKGASAVATHSILGDTVVNGLAGLISKNSVRVEKENRYLDAVISLNGLQPHTQYKVYCHMDEVVLSEPLLVWTAVNTLLYDIAFIPSTTKTGVKPALHFSFSHGADIKGGASIVITAAVESTGTNGLIFATSDAVEGCAVTTTYHGATSDFQTASIATGDTQTTLTVTAASGASTIYSRKGSRIDIVCLDTGTTARFAANSGTAAGDYVTFKLAVTGHTTVEKQRAWTVTAA